MVLGEGFQFAFVDIIEMGHQETLEEIRPDEQVGKPPRMKDFKEMIRRGRLLNHAAEKFIAEKELSIAVV